MDFHFAEEVQEQVAERAGTAPESPPKFRPRSSAPSSDPSQMRSEPAPGPAGHIRASNAATSSPAAECFPAGFAADTAMPFRFPAREPLSTQSRLPTGI